MPRRNKRETYEPLDLTPPHKTISDPKPSANPFSSRYERPPRLSPEHRARLAAERQQAARMKQGIDWSVCLVPGCGAQLRAGLVDGDPGPGMRDPSIWLPMCTTHAVVVWENMNRWWSDENVKAEQAAHAERAAAQAKALERHYVVCDQGGQGVIYFLRQNGLVKIGWSSDIEKRLRAYGPNVEILCHYPGSRQDETTLHRQLRDHLAKGREWYHDDAAIELFVSEAIKRHGPPRLAPHWTQPKSPTIKTRSRR